MKNLLTNTERKRVERQKKRDAGLVPKEVWIHPDRHEDLKKAVLELQKPSK